MQMMLTRAAVLLFEACFVVLIILGIISLVVLLLWPTAFPL